MPHPLAPSAEDAWLPDFLEPGQAFSVFVLSGGARVLVRARREGDRRVVDQWTFGPPLRALDRTVFTIDDHFCAERERYTALGGPNLHPQPIPLPSRMRRGETREILPGATVRPAFVGLVEHRGLRLEALALETAQGREQRVLWSARGLGELLIQEGSLAAPGPILRELVAWTDGTRALGEPLRPPGDLPDLPPVAGPGGRPRGLY